MQEKVTAAVREASEDRQVLPLQRALEAAIFSAMVPERMQWGRSRGTYPGQHIVRKLVLKYEAEIGKMNWCRAAILAGPDVKGHLESLTDWTAPVLRSTFSPVAPSRISMWACLMGLTFKTLPGAEALWRSQRVSVETFRRHCAKLQERSGVPPHLKQVWQSLLAEFATEG